MNDPRSIAVVDHPLDAEVTLPGSKSITNRCLLMAALAEGESLLEHALMSQDSLIFAECLRRLGIPVEADEAASSFRVEGQGGRLRDGPVEMFVGNAGTAARFVPPLALLGRGKYSFDGVPAMRLRPMRDLLLVLEAQGARFSWGGAPYHLPFTLESAGGLAGGALELSAEKTSQQATGLLMVGPYASEALHLRLTGKIVSQSYLDMTDGLMRAWGASVERPDASSFVVENSARYRARTQRIEPDASSASYFFAAAAAVGGRVRVHRLSRASLQGDLQFVEVLASMGCEVIYGDELVEVRRSGPLRGVEVDMNTISDTAPTLAAIAPLADGPVIIRNVEHMRWKETDRIAALVTELRRLGAEVEELRDGLIVKPGPLHPAAIETYDDHRIAMAFSILGLRSPGVVIKDPGCVAKTFPGFFAELSRMTSI